MSTINPVSAEANGVSTANKLSPKGVCVRLAIPFFVFSAIFAGLLTLSSYTLLPTITQIEIGGEKRDARELKEYHSTLAASLVGFQEERDDFVDPLHGTLYEQLKKNKEREYYPLAIYRTIEQAIQTFSGSKNIVVLKNINIMTGRNRVEIAGDIRNVGPRSMTVLAQFADQLRAQPFVTRLSDPVFTREEDKKIGFYSPFHFVIELQDPVSENHKKDSQSVAGS